MELALYGFEIYGSEVDDHGIDFVARPAGTSHYFRKSVFQLHPNLMAAVVYFFDELAPKLYLIPSMAWLSPNAVLVSRDYEGKKSAPEWGISWSQKNRHLLETYEFDKITSSLVQGSENRR